MPWLNIFNSSIFNNSAEDEPDLNSTMAGNQSSSDKIHNCVDDDFSGLDYGGNYFKCDLCAQMMFVNCIVDRPEVNCLLKLIVPSERSTSKLNTTDSRVLKKFKSINFLK